MPDSPGAGGGSPGLQPFSTQPIWSRSEATIGLPMAMYSKSFVGLPKKGVPSGFGTCGESRMSEAASVRGVSAWGRIPASVTKGRPRPSPRIERTRGASAPSPT